MMFSSFTDRIRPIHVFAVSISLGAINILVNLLPVSEKALMIFNAIFGMSLSVLVTLSLFVLYRVSKKQQYSFTRTIFWLFITMVGWMAGDIIYTFLLLRNVDPFFSIADIFYILASLLLIVSLLTLARTQPVLRKRRLVFIEMSILILSATVIFMLLLFLPGNPYLDYDVPSLTLMCVFPVLDMIQIWIIMIVFFTYSINNARKVLSFLFLAVAGLLFSDSVYLINNLYDPLFRDYLIDIGYYMFYVFLFLSGLAGFKEIRELPSEREKSFAIFNQNNWIVFLPGIFMIAVIGFLIIFAMNNSLALFPGIIVLIIIVIILFIIHQYLLIAENIELNKEMRDINTQLESKVELRTIELSKTNFDLQTEINERENVERNLAKSNEELALINNDKDRLFTIMAHDLRSPIGSIMKLSELIVDNFNDFDVTELLEITKAIRKSSAQTFQLLDDLLAWSAVQMGKMMREKEVFSPSEAVSEIIDILSPVASDKEIQIKNDVDSESTVFADSFAVQTILRNLLSNAIKFTKHNGSIIIKAEPKIDFIKISVIDNGVGISKEKQKKIFKIDELNSAIGTDGEKGTGFGLLLSKDLVERNGGEIGFESEKGKGSIFYFTLPAIKTPDISGSTNSNNSILYSFDPVKKLGFTTITGRVNSEGLKAGIKRIWNSSNFNSEYPVIVDIRQADLVFDFTDLSDFIAAFAHMPDNTTNRKLAILTSSPQHVAFSTIFSKEITSKYELNIEIFSTYEACVIWCKG